MDNIYARTGDFNELSPIRSDAYADVLVFWLWVALGSRELKHLHECLADTRGYENEQERYPRAGHYAPPVLFHGQRRPFRQRLRLEQASLEALQLITEMRDETYANYAEVADDLIFPLDQLAASDRCIRRHLRMRYHRQHMHTVETTLYFNKLGSPRNLLTYPDKLSKLKPHEPCVHVEVRMKGHTLLAANRLGTVADWIYLDYRAFLEPRLLFCDLDFGRLGRLLHNKLTGDGRRTARAQDYKDGLHDFHQHGLIKDSDGNSYLSIQKYIDQRHHYVNLYPALIKLDNSALLPEKSTFTPYYECISNVFVRKSHASVGHPSASGHSHPSVRNYPRSHHRIRGYGS
jgi:hypothetical protein